MKNIKRALCALLSVIVLLSACCVQAFALPETPFEDSRFFESGDYEIHYRVVEHTGEYKGRIMLLHGFLCSTYAWRNMAKGFSEKGYDCYMADLPNFGYSTRETPGMNFIDREDLIVSLMESVAPTSEWILGGHSMGGGVAVNIAEEHPVKALLLFCPAPQSTCPAGMENIITSKPMRFVMNTFFKIGTKLSPVVKLVVYAATRDLKFSLGYDVNGVTGPFLYDGIGAGMCTMLTVVRETNLAEADKITCPVLLVEASGDIIINAEMKNAFYDAFPRAVTYTVDGGGHQCIENRADELVELAAEFVEK